MARLRVGAFPGGTAGARRGVRRRRPGRGHRHRRLARHPRALWEKFCFLAALSGCTSLARQPVGVIRADPDLRATFEAAVREAWTLGRAKGVPLPDDFVAAQMRALDGLPAEMHASMLNDLEAGQRLEAPWLSGAVARSRRTPASPRR